MVALLPMNERYIRWYTPWLSREFEMAFDLLDERSSIRSPAWPATGAVRDDFLAHPDHLVVEAGLAPAPWAEHVACT